jgi:hypothetical protein
MTEVLVMQATLPPASTPRYSPRALAATRASVAVAVGVEPGGAQTIEHAESTSMRMNRVVLANGFDAALGEPIATRWWTVLLFNLPNGATLWSVTNPCARNTHACARNTRRSTTRIRHETVGYREVLHSEAFGSRPKTSG